MPLCNYHEQQVRTRSPDSRTKLCRAVWVQSVPAGSENCSICPRKTMSANTSSEDRFQLRRASPPQRSQELRHPKFSVWLLQEDCIKRGSFCARSVRDQRRGRNKQRNTLSYLHKDTVRRWRRRRPGGSVCRPPEHRVLHLSRNIISNCDETGELWQLRLALVFSPYCKVYWYNK